MGFTVGDLRTLVRAGLTREELPPPPPETPLPGSRPGLLQRLFAVETLPTDPPRPPREGVSLLRAVFAPEALPVEPPGSDRAGARRPWLAWLFVPEKLDPPAPPGPGSP
jgi:hypothetical protein